MFQNLKVRVLVIVLAILGSAYFLYAHPINYGLDLQGGVHLALEVDTKGAAMSDKDRADAIDRAMKVVRLRVDELGVTEPIVQKAGSDRIIVELAGKKVDQARAKEVVQKTAFLEFKIVRPVSELQALLPKLDRVIAQAGKAGAAPATAASPSGALLQPRTDTAKTDTAAAASTGTGTASLLQAKNKPAAVDSATGGGATPLSGLIRSAGNAGQVLVDSARAGQIEAWLALPQVKAAMPRGTEILWGQPKAEVVPGLRSLYFVTSEPMLTGEQLETAQAESDQFQRPIVTFQLSRIGGRQFEKATGAHIGEPMAIVLDNRVYTAPTINGEIGSRGQIELGKATIEDATELALVLRAGALPAPLHIVEERSVGPSLGADSVRNSLISGVVGIGLVVLMMLFIYHFSGVLAVVALTVYCVIVMGLLSMLNATLTFPGIAGLILSVGMAVDANILIFERTREELEHGRTARVAVNEGFHHALRAIIDSNVTSLITAAILFYTGTGPIRGFAVTLTVGVIASMFTAVFVTRTLFMLYLERRTAAQGISI
ncbi:MAG: SecD export rane protein [Gemmatimonadetes bacterium]|nr:SecD export rane protein [Gemmatimonadota bacterium]